MYFVGENVSKNEKDGDRTGRMNETKLSELNREMPAIPFNDGIYRYKTNCTAYMYVIDGVCALWNALVLAVGRDE